MEWHGSVLYIYIYICIISIIIIIISNEQVLIFNYKMRTSAAKIDC